MDNIDLAIKCSRMSEGLDIHVCNIKYKESALCIEISQVHKALVKPTSTPSK